MTPSNPEAPKKHKKTSNTAFVKESENAGKKASKGGN